MNNKWKCGGKFEKTKNKKTNKQKNTFTLQCVKLSFTSAFFLPYHPDYHGTQFPSMHCQEDVGGGARLSTNSLPPYTELRQ